MSTPLITPELVSLDANLGSTKTEVITSVAGLMLPLDAPTLTASPTTLWTASPKARPVCPVGSPSPLPLSRGISGIPGVRPAVARCRLQWT
ncbi:PTS system [Cutibacterium acnes JCM 18909]|nr:PTS system [Cutibacterium acnes JCM 18909]